MLFEKILWTALTFSMVFLVVMVLLLRRKWRKEAEWKKAHPAVNEMIEMNEERKKDGDWIGPGGRPDGKEAC